MLVKPALIVLPVLAVVACGGSASKPTGAQPASTSAVVTSAAPVLDTQGKIFCTLVDKARAEYPDVTSDNPTANLGTVVDDETKAATAAKQSSNQAVHAFIGKAGGGFFSGDDLPNARKVCESQGWVGNP